MGHCSEGMYHWAKAWAVVAKAWAILAKTWAILAAG